MPTSKRASQQKERVPKPPKVKVTASERQTAFVNRKRAAGYVQLSGVFVPALAREEAREVLKKFVAEWEAKNVQTF